MDIVNKVGLRSDGVILRLLCLSGLHNEVYEILISQYLNREATKCIYNRPYRPLQNSPRFVILLAALLPSLLWLLG